MRALRNFAPRSTLPLSLAWAASLICLAPPPPACAAELSWLPPESLLGTWDFDDPSLDHRSLDRMQGIPIEFTGEAAFSADGAGRSALPGDRALDLGITGNNSGRIVDLEFLNRVNQNNADTDRLTVVFWQRWATATVNESSTVWFASPASGSGDRGFHAHLPWGSGSAVGTGTVYFDTSGCCSTPTQRLSAGITSVFPNFDWGRWHHVALVKEGGAKQIWIDGHLFLAQSTGAIPLLSDWTEVVLGHPVTQPQYAFRGWIDDFAVFATALDDTHVAALASGLTPLDLVLPADEWPPSFTSLLPDPSLRRHPGLE